MTRGIALLLLLLTPIIAVVGNEFCNCEYTVPEHFEPNCRVFGDIGGSPVPWELASEKCVEQLGVSVSALTRDALWKICPFSNSSNVEVQLLRNFLRSGDNSGVETVRAALPKFFRPADADGTSYVLRDHFLDTRNSVVNCTVSTRLCWSVIHDHFVAESNAREIACRSLHNYQQESKAEEQLRARSALACNDSSVPAACLDVQQQIESLRDSAASCEALGAPSSVEPLQCNWLNPPQLSAAAASPLAALSVVLLLVTHAAIYH